MRLIEIIRGMRPPSLGSSVYKGHKRDDIAPLKRRRGRPRNRDLDQEKITAIKDVKSRQQKPKKRNWRIEVRWS